MRKYQQSNGLSVDGITGSQTWGKLLGGGSSGGGSSGGSTPGSSAPVMQTTPMGTEYDSATMTGAQADLNKIEGSMPQYQPSQEYTDALAALKQHQMTKPGEYVSPFNDRLEALYQKVMGRGDFNYDFNADALYHQYRDRYAQEGQRAMQDTMANAAALTGGYGNSYAATAGQQAYNQYMQAANDVIPTLEQRAFERWMAEGDGVMEQLALLRDMDATEYGRHRDQQSDYWAMLEYLTDAAGDQYGRDYQQYQDALDAFLQNRDYYAQKAALEAVSKSSGSGSGGGRSGGSKKSGSAGGGSSGGDKLIDSVDNVGRAVRGDELTVSEATSVLEGIANSEGVAAAREELENMLANNEVRDTNAANRLKEAMDAIASSTASKER